MNRKAYAGILVLIFLAFAFLTGCGSSSSPSPPPPVTTTITATSGSGQSVTVGTAFAAPLVATVMKGGTPVSGATVTFTAPTSGASGTFAGGANTATTNSSGVATSAVFTANTTAGAYTVTASVSGGSTPASFSLTNTAGAAATITATGGTPQSAVVGRAFAAPLTATVVDSYSNPVSGVSVTFTAPGSGASGTFANGTATDTEATNSSGVAASSTFTANATAGGPYTVTATATGVATAANFSLTNIPMAMAFYLSGWEAINGGDNYYALAGSVAIDGNGNVLAGEQDYNDAFGLTSPEPSPDTITGGTLTVDPTTGQGTLTLITDNPGVGVGGTETLGVQFVNVKHALIVQFDGSATSSGSMDMQTLPSTPSGNYAFTLSGVDSSYAPQALGGVFTISGTSMSGVVDVNDDGYVTTGNSFNATLSSADSFGRGTITGTGTTLVYYIVGPEVIRIIDVDTTDSAVGSAFGQGAGTFANASLGSSVFGIENSSYGTAYAAAGALTTTPASGTFQGVGDDDEEGFIASDSAISGEYSIGSDGYGSLTIDNGGLGDVSALGIYMTDPNLNLDDPNNTTSGGGALVLDLDDVLASGTGVVIPQTDTSTANFTGNYAFGAQVYNAYSWEFDFVGQGPVASLALSGTGLVSDPYLFFGANTTNTGTFSGTATPDGVTAGRYTMPLTITVGSGSPVDFTVVIYQASGGQLFWVDEDDLWLFGGPLEQQGSLTGLP